MGVLKMTKPDACVNVMKKRKRTALFGLVVLSFVMSVVGLRFVMTTRQRSESNLEQGMNLPFKKVDG
jgi:hypothetical protein